VQALRVAGVIVFSMISAAAAAALAFTLADGYWRAMATPLWLCLVFAGCAYQCFRSWKRRSPRFGGRP
jgi:hypothetical protein